MRAAPPLRVVCAHLAGLGPRPRLFRTASNRPFELRLGSDEPPLVVSFCVECAKRLGAVDGSPSALRLAALTVLHRHLHSQLASIVDTLAELTPLLSSTSDEPRSEP